MAAWELAQVNIGTTTAPLTSEQLRWFVEALVPVNAVADSAPGFRWRLQTEDGDATALRIFDDDQLLVNMSVWASLESLAAFVYRDAAHTAVLRRRREGFVRLAEAHQALWWVPSGHRPTVREAEERLEHLRGHGPTAHAFTFRAPFPAPDAPGVVEVADDWHCRV